jgi:hypothetical protein
MAKPTLNPIEYPAQGGHETNLKPELALTTHWAALISYRVTSERGYRLLFPLPETPLPGKLNAPMEFTDPW